MEYQCTQCHQDTENPEIFSNESLELIYLNKKPENFVNILCENCRDELIAEIYKIEKYKKKL